MRPLNPLSAPGRAAGPWHGVVSVARVVCLVGWLAAFGQPGTAQAQASGICGRTEEVRIVIVASVSGVSDCAAVTDTHLAAITFFRSVATNHISELKAGDFDGLSGLVDLYLTGDDIQTLPAGIFNELTALKNLQLDNNWISGPAGQRLSLHAGVFDSLTSLETLNLSGNRINALPEGLFDRLTGLKELDLSNNRLRQVDLPDRLFEPLTALTALNLSRNRSGFGPQAIATPDDGQVSAGGGTVDLDGSASGGLWGTNVTYKWALTAPTSGVTVAFDDDAIATPKVTIPVTPAGTELTFTLTVSAPTDTDTDGIGVRTNTAKVTSVGTLTLNVAAVATDDAVNIAEKAAGFAISGDTGTESGVSVSVVIGGTTLTATSSGDGAWSVDVPADATYIAGTSVAFTVSATKTGFTAAAEVVRTLTVDLAAPTAPSYTAPDALKVGVAITAMNPAGGADVDEYSAPGLPAGLGIDGASGAITGTPTTAAAAATVTVTVSDDADNTATVNVAFPAVVKGDQTLLGFAYSADTATVGQAAPTVTEPSGVQTQLRYTAAPPTVCTVVEATGALTLVGAGTCTVTARAESNDDWNEASVTDTVTVVEASDTATLSGLTVSDGSSDRTLAPPFAPNTFAYTASVKNTVDEVTLTATVTDPGAQVSGVTLDGTAINDNDFSDGITVPSLVVGDNEIVVKVTAQDTTSTEDYTVTVTRSSNLVPTAADEVITVLEDTAHTFAAAEFNFSDGDATDTLKSVTVVTLPAAGALALDGTAVTAGEVVPVGDIGTLVFTPVANANGMDYASFEFRVSDGEDDSDATYTVTMHVTADNDAPTGGPTISGTAKVGQPLTAATTGIDDVDGLDSVSYDYQWIRVDADGTSNATDIADATASTYTLADADAGKKVKVKVEFTDDGNTEETLTSGAYPANGTIEAGGICGRTEEVRIVIVASVSGVSDCAAVTDTHLAAITFFRSVATNHISELKAGDFDGLSGLVDLYLTGDDIQTLPAGIFNELTSLKNLQLDNNWISGPAGRRLSLHAGVFDSLTSLETLNLSGNRINALPAGLFDRLTGLKDLNLSNNRLRQNELPDRIFEPLRALTVLNLASNPTGFGPAAIATPDDGQVSAGGGTVDLDGSASGGLWGTNVTYKWALTAPTSGVTVAFDDDTIATPNVLIPELTAGTELTFTLTVSAPTDTDSDGIGVRTNTAKVTSVGTLTLSVAAAEDIAGDGVVNIAEKAAGFAISGDTGSESGASVEVAIGGATLTATSADDGSWSVDVPANADYITATSVDVTVSAAKAGYTAPADVVRTLTVDLTAPTAPTYTAPDTLKVGETITAMSPTGGSDINGYEATDLPAGLDIDTTSGVISATPTAADTSTATATVTVSDAAGNTDTVNIAFPAVVKGDQTLLGFAYSADTATVGQDVPTVTPPSGVQTKLGYTASPASVCTVDAVTGALTLVGAGTCTVTATAEANDNWNKDSVTDTVTVSVLPTLTLNVAAAENIATDGVVNIAEKAAGFAISGDTGTESGVSVSVAIGGATLTTTSDTNGAWSVDVPGGAAYITGTSVDVTVSASKTGFTAPADVVRTLTVDLVAPTAPTYAAPDTLKVGETITAMSPTGGSGINGYEATDLPAGLDIDTTSGVISATPTAADTSTATATVTVSDAAGNTDTVNITFPAVVKGDQTLLGFAYSADTATVGQAAPTVTEPSGVQTSLEYSTDSAASVCTVDAATGALTLVGAGTCTVTATAEADDDWNKASVTDTVTVSAAGTLTLNVDAITTDDRINIAEHTAGFTISGNTGTEAGVGVTVLILVGGRPELLGATSADLDPNDGDTTATWSVAVPADASYIAGTSVSVTVNANKTGFLSPPSVVRTLTVDLVAPTAPSYTAPDTLKVNETITAMSPSGGVGIDEYGATGLPAGLDIDTTSGAISGTPTAAEEATATATVTVSDTAGNTDTVDITFPAVSVGNLVLNVGVIAGDDTINAAEQADGFAITGATGTESGVSVSVAIATETLTATSDTNGAWSVDVPGNATYIAGTGVSVTVSATKTGYTAAAEVVRTLTVDLVAPTPPSYTAPASLKVGDAITEMTPSGGADIDEYEATGLPAGLEIDETTGVIDGTPTAVAAAATATVTVSDAAGNTDTVGIAFPAVAALGTLSLSVDAIATDDAVNIAEKALGFAITGATGTESGVSVSVAIATETLTATSDTNGAWSVDVPGNATYIAGTGVSVTVSATKTGYTAAAEVVRTLTVDLVAPTPPSYTAPDALKVGDAIEAMSPAGGADVDEYSAPDLPAGLSIDGTSGAITGTPTAAVAAATVTVTVSDDADNTATVNVAFPAVLKGDQTLLGFAYSANTATVGQPVPTVTEPSGAQTQLRYTVSDEAICSVVALTGALTLEGGTGTCTVTATAESNDHWNEARVTFDVVVQAAATQVTLTVSDERVYEHEGTTSVTVTGTLNNAVRNSATRVAVTVGASDDAAVEGTDYAAVKDFTLTIDPGRISGTATFSLTPADDELDEAHETLTVSGSTSAPGLTVSATTITLGDDDDRGIDVSPGTLTLSEGGSANYTVVLTSEPTGDVTVTPSVTGSADVTLNTDSLTFTKTDWKTVRTVTVSGAQDADSLDDTATIQHTVSGADYADNGVIADEVSVTVRDDETASTAIALTVSDGRIEEDSDATTITVTATLNDAPRTEDTEMTVSVGGADDAAEKGTDYSAIADFSLTIPAEQTAGTATFSLAPVDDDLDEADETLTVAGRTPVSGLAVTGTTIAIVDDDQRGVKVTPTTLPVSEGGSSTYTVVLTSEPTGPVTVTPSVDGSPDVTLDVSSLTFAPANWASARTVTVSAAQDADEDNDTARIEHSVTGADYGSNDVTAHVVAVTVRDDETASTGVTLTLSHTDVEEGAGSVIVTVTGTLNQGPLDTDTAVTIAVGAPGDAPVDGTDYVFAAVGELTLTIGAGETTGTARFVLNARDDAVDEGAEALSVNGVAEGLEVTGTTIAIADNDTRKVSVSPTALSVPEGASASYSLVLESQPTSPVTVTPSVQGESDLTLSPGSVTFTSLTWRIAQEVTVTAGGDADADDDRVRIEHAVAGGDYGSEVPGGVSVTVRDNFLDNNAPVFPATLPMTLEVAENTLADTPIGTPFAATDMDGHALKYALEGLDADSFAIDPESGQFKTLAALDHETKTRFELTVAVDDGHGGKADVPVTVTVSDVDEQPGTPASPRVLATPGSTTGLGLRWSVPERNGGPDIVGYTVQYREGEAGAWRDHRHTGTDTRATILGLAAETVYQARIRALNGETPGEWSEPGSGNTGRVDNAAPVFDAGLTGELTVDENTGAGTDLGVAFTATDTDGDALTYLLDGPDRRAFAIDPESGQLSTRASLDHETQASHSVTVRADDGNGGTDTIAVTIAVSDIAEQAGTLDAPVVLAAAGTTTSLEVSWSAPELNGGPPVAGYAVQYRTVEEGDQAPWIEHRHTGADTRAIVDYLDAATLYQARVRALNGEIAGEWSEPGAGSTGNPANTPPVFDDDLTTEVRVEEHAVSGIHIGRPFTATDADADTLTYQLYGANRNAFAIDPVSGQLSTRAALDHEAKSSYSVMVRVSDGRSGADAIRVRVDVVDLAEKAPPVSAPGVLASAGSTTSLDLRWDAPARNGGPAITGYEVQYRAGTDDAWIDHVHEGADTRATIAELAAATDYEARVRALNGEIPGDWSVPGVGNTGRADNNPPVFDSGLPSTLTVNENVGTDTGIGSPFSASDSDGDTLTWLLDGTDRQVFAIDADNGQLRTRAALDHETKDAYALIVRVSDGAGDADSIELAVNVADLDEIAAQPLPPWVLSAVGTDTGLDVRWSAPAENGGPPIAGYELQYREGSDGVWTDHVHEDAGTRATIADLEAATDYQVRVRALNGETPGEWSRPGAGNTARPDNRAPAFYDDATTRSVPENNEAGDPVGAPVTAADEDRDGLTYFLEGTDAEPFEIDPQTGQIRTKTVLDYETQAVYRVTVVANDGNGGADTIDVGIEVIDSQEQEAEMGPSAPTALALGRALSLDSGNVVQAQITLTWDFPESDGVSADEDSWFEFRLGRYPESSNGLAAPAYQCAGNRPFGRDGWRRIPESGPEGANARAYRFDAQALGCHVLADTFELRAQVRAVSVPGEGATPRASSPSTEARMRDEAPRVIGTWLNASDEELPGLGEELVFSVAFTEPVRVVAANGSPTLEIRLGEAARQARFAGASRPPAFRDYGSGHIGSLLEFRYTVQEGDDLSSGLFVAANAISISGGATIVDATGPGAHAADLRNPRTTIAEGSTVVAESADGSLAASFEPESVPQSHDGETAFSVQVRFDDSTSTQGSAGGDASESNEGAEQDDQTTTKLGQLTLSESSFLVTGGRVTDVAPLVEGDHQRWTVELEPDSRADVSISLGPTIDCTDEGAVCAADGRRLANNIHAVIQGPPGLSVADARVEEAPGATMDFTVTLSRASSEAVSVEFATSDATATAGQDYTETSGTLIFEVGDIARTVSVPVLDDAHDDDGETFTLTLSNPSGGNAYVAHDTATGTIENADPMPKAWIARFGRTVSDHVVDAIQGRFADGPRESHLTLGGRRVDGLFERWQAGATQWQASMDRLSSGLQDGSAPGSAPAYRAQWGGYRTPATEAAMGSGFAGGGFASSTGPQVETRGDAAGGNGLPSLRHLLMGSSFSYSNVRAEQDADSPDAEGLNRWTAWGRMAATRFRGNDGPLSLNGEVATGMLGVDAAWNRWLAGVVLARSDGEGGYAHATASGGSLTSTLTSLHPFAHYRFNERTSVWGTIGYGLGDLSLTPEAATASINTDLRTSMAALGGRGVLSVRTGTVGSFELALRSDAMLTETRSGVSQNLLSATGATTRVRLILEGSGTLPLRTGGVLTPTLEAGLRYDGGDAETGAGLEIGGGLAYTSGPLSAQVNVRGLLAHEDAAYEEWGFSGSITYQPGKDNRGLSMKLGSAWGATQSGVRSLWSRPDAGGLVPGTAMDLAQRFQAELGYGLEGPSGRALWVAFIGTEAGQGGNRSLRTGVKLTSGSNVEAGLEIGRRTAVDGDAQLAVEIRGTIRW